MIKNIMNSLLLVVVAQYTHAQLVINELDSDTKGIDTLEIVELKSEVPNFKTDGYVLVFFNGSDNGMDSSYFALDLDDLQTDANGLLLIGSNQLTPAPDWYLEDNFIQNGADGVAIYKGNWNDFPFFTPATTTNIIDALVYDTADTDDKNLLQLLGETQQINEDENGNKDTESIQRKNDGTYEIKTPTPGVPNDGSGVRFHTISFSLDTDRYEEGERCLVTFSLDTMMDTDFYFNFYLTNDTFNTSDYATEQNLIIPSGQTSIITQIQLVDDEQDEGDEVMLLRFGTLPDTLKRLVDRKKITIIDNDFKNAGWGTPLEPTFGQVLSTAPSDYYDTLDGKAAGNLTTAIGEIIANPSTTRSHTYEDVIQMLKEADQSPLNSNKVWLMYTEQERSKIDFQFTGVQTGKWNREHVYPRSRGGYFSIQEDEEADGIAIFTTTNRDSIRHGNSDGHGLRVVDSKENSSRGNKNYGAYTGPDDTQGSWHGDVARSIFYMTMRYKGLSVVEGFPKAAPVGFIGDLDTLLKWHQNDPPDDFEMNRNNMIYKWQKNRNPFIDIPELAAYIWGKEKGAVWKRTLGITESDDEGFLLFPNPAREYLQIITKEKTRQIDIYNLLGTLLLSQKVPNTTKIPLELPPGIYFIKIEAENREILKRLLISN